MRLRYHVLSVVIFCWTSIRVSLFSLLNIDEISFSVDFSDQIWISSSSRSRQFNAGWLRYLERTMVRNSSRVRGSSLKTPTIMLVIVRLWVFWTPRITMHMCLHMRVLITVILQYKIVFSLKQTIRVFSFFFVRQPWLWPNDKNLLQEAQLSLTNRPTLLSDEWLRFIGLIFRLLPTPLPFDALNEAMSSSYQFHIWCGKTRMPRLQSGEGRLMIDSVVWPQYINATNTHTQPRRHNTVRRAAKTVRRRSV